MLTKTTFVRSDQPGLIGGRRPCVVCRQMQNSGAGFLVSLGQVKLRLQGKPELRIDAEPVPKPQGGVDGDRSLAADVLGNAVGARHAMAPIP